MGQLFRIMDERLKIFISVFPLYLPTIIVCIAALAVIFNRWRQAPEASRYALMGFGTTLLVSLLMPVVRALVQSWALDNAGEGRRTRMWVFTAFSFFSMIVQVVVYCFLLIAIYTGRRKSASAKESETH
jgi:hypothetical protein